MRRFGLLLLVVLLAISVVAVFAGKDDAKKDKAVTEANVWKTADGEKHFVCPVMGEEGVVDEKTTFSVVDGKKYYHCCSGCSEKFTANPSEYLSKTIIPGNVVKVDEDGKYYKCPVSGEMGLVTDKTLYADYDGKRYYFCCANCKPKFEAEPEKFIDTGAKKEMKKHHGHNH